VVSWTELATIPGVVVGGHALSPLIFLHLQRSGSFAEDSVILQQIVDKMLEEGVLLSASKRSLLDKCKLGAGICIMVTASHTEAELLSVSSSLRNVIQSVVAAQS
jgi:serine palmitoyltransferase